MTGIKTTKFIVLSLILAAVVILGVIKGPVNIPLRQLLLADNRQILNLRLLRIFLAAVTGCGLAVAGIALQAILRNPLAEPYLLGTSSGAGLGAVIAIVAGISQLYLPIAAFIGAIASIIMVYAVAAQNSRLSEHSLILSGVIISVALSAIMVFLISISTNEALYGITWWLWGSLGVYNLKLLLIASFIVITCVTVMYVFAQDLNAISLGEEEATHVGIDSEQVKKTVILLTSLITASLVCICGVIGFVGLIIPHMVRLVVGPNHKILIPAACLGAAIFMVACDIVARVVFAPVEIPIGVITALLGAPVFIILFKKSDKIS